MKRSRINSIIKSAENFIRDMNFALPPWTSWTEEEWLREKDSCGEIFQAGLGWDITDFGSEDFPRRGLVLITLRNGVPGKTKKPYAEKIMVVGEEQETPFHFHRHKMEDIINRGGGNLAFELYNSTKDEELSPDPVTVSIDGITRIFEAGETIVLKPGMSLTLEQGIYHRFYGEKGSQLVLTGEVSMVNDDKTDNRFYDAGGRFPKIGEDEPPYRLLIGDYTKRLGILPEEDILESAGTREST